MSRGAFWFLLLLASGGILVVYTWVSLDKEADHFVARVDHEVLEQYADSVKPEAMIEPVLKIAKEEGIPLEREDVKAGYKNPDKISTVAAIDAMKMDSFGDVVELQLSFRLTKHLLSRRFERSLDKALKDITYADRQRSSPGFPVGVDVPVPVRSVESYRQSVQKAASGTNE